MKSVPVEELLSQEGYGHCHLLNQIQNHQESLQLSGTYKAVGRQK